MGRARSLDVAQSAGRSAKKLIRAAVDAAKGEGTPPALLGFAWQCQKWNMAPVGGGLLIQEYRRMMVMSVLDNVYQTVKHVRSLVGEQIKYMSVDEGRVIAALRADKLL